MCCLSHCHLPPMEMNSKAEPTPAERLLNLCSLCLMPPTVIQIPYRGSRKQTNKKIHQEVCESASVWTNVFSCLRDTHRYEQYTSQQRPGERRFDDLFVTFAACSMPPQQCGDVKCHLCDGAKRSIHHRSHCKVTLCRKAEERTISQWNPSS